MSEKLRVVCCHRWGADWRWIADLTDPQAIAWEFVCPPAGGPVNLLDLSWRAVQLARRTDAHLLVTHGPALALRSGLFRRLTRARTPQLAYSFHYDVDPSPAKCRVMARMARGIDRFVLYSTAEVDHYSRLFGIPREAIEMTYWGIEPPGPSAAGVPIIAGDYVCTVGSSARDYPTFLAAATRLPEIPFVAIVRPESLAGLDVPPNVKVLVNLPQDEMTNVLVHSRAVAIPLTPTARSGHSVLVLALHHGKAAVMTDVPGVRDYLRDGETALGCPPSDPEAMAAAIRRLWDDRELARRLEERGRGFARSRCTDRAIAEQFRTCLDRLVLDRHR